MKLELLTNVTVVDDAIRFVSSMSKGKIKYLFNNSNEADKEESNEPDYDEDLARRRPRRGSRINNKSSIPRISRYHLNRE